MSMDVSRFRVPEGKRVDLKKWPTKVTPFYDSKEHYRLLLADHVDRLAQRQDMLYAHDRYALLLIFQAMDAAGKDSVIKHVMSGINPQGCQVFSFKHPSATELDHDFMWRTTTCLPERGRIGIFNRSYYEEVLIVRVHPEILQAQRLPDEVFADANIWNAMGYALLGGLSSSTVLVVTVTPALYLLFERRAERRRLAREAAGDAAGGAPLALSQPVLEPA